MHAFASRLPVLLPSQSLDDWAEPTAAVQVVAGYLDDDDDAHGRKYRCRTTDSRATC